MKGKKFFSKVVILLAVLFTTLIPSSKGEALELRFNVMYSPKHPVCKEVFDPWAEEVAKATNGRVKVTMFYSNALCKAPQLYDATTSGVTDIGVSCPTYTRDRFLMSGVMDLPMVAGQSAKISSEVLWQLYETFPEMQKEYSDVKLLWLYMNPAYHLHFTKKQVRTLEELKGLIISAGGTVSTHILKALGASPESIPMTDVYLALQKGVVEGCFLPYAPLRSQRMADLLHYHTEANLVANTFYVIMNKDLWKKITPEDRKTIEKISGLEAARLTGSTFDKYQEIDRTWMAKKGDKFFSLEPSETRKWTERIMPLREEWVKDTESRGLPGRKLLEETLRLLSEKR
jgi:TRAP-type C4-dicarboxylate transport system substrate-binding protein